MEQEQDGARRHLFIAEHFGRKFHKSEESRQTILSVDPPGVEFVSAGLEEALRQGRRVVTVEEFDEWKIQTIDGCGFIEVDGAIFVPMCLDARDDKSAPINPKLRGGLGKHAASACQKDSHNPHKKGTVGKLCHLSHTQWDPTLEPHDNDVRDARLQTYEPYGTMYMYIVVQMLRSWMHIKTKFPCPSSLPPGRAGEIAKKLLNTNFEAACQPNAKRSVSCYLSEALWDDAEWQAEEQHKKEGWTKESEVGE